MRFFVAVTDNAWFHFLAEARPDEVNFWRPVSTRVFRALEPGAPFLFKLHSPENFIVGGGFFVRHTVLPLSLAWEAFGPKNGAPDLAGFRARIRRYRRLRGLPETPDPPIGCILLTSPFFFPREAWIPAPPDWPRNLVFGKRFDTDEPTGRRLWRAVQERLEGLPLWPALEVDPKALQPALQVRRIREIDRREALYVLRARLGQGAFRVLVLEAYRRRCAVTGEKALPVLQAAHIKPYAESGPHRVDNGLLLRADLHILFDRGYLTVVEDRRQRTLRVEVSRRLREDFDDGEAYEGLQGRPLAVLPDDPQDRPSAAFLAWHNEHVFRG